MGRVGKNGLGGWKLAMLKDFDELLRFGKCGGMLWNVVECCGML